MNISRDEFEQETRIIDGLIDRRATLPEQVFRRNGSAFHVIDFDVLWSEEFICFVKHLTAQTADRWFTFAVLRPDPDAYYYAHFGKFPFLRLTHEDAGDRFISAVHEDPGGSPADAIAYNSEVILVYPASARWAIYGDRNLEIAIVAAMDEEIAAAICASNHAVKFFTPAEAVTALLAPVYAGVVPEEVMTSLVRNYTAGVAGV